MNEWTAIRLLRDKGQSIKKISVIMKVSKNTVRKVLRRGSYKEYRGENRRESKSKVAVWKDEILKMLVKDNYIGSRILNELKTKGFGGSATAFYDYLARIKREVDLSKISERYETAEGEMAQFDWSPYTVSIGEKVCRVIIFTTILCYSRYRRYFVSLDDKQGSIFEALEDAFWHFGGVPKRLLVDNAKAMVKKRTPVETEWNCKFLEFMGGIWRDLRGIWGQGDLGSFVRNVRFFLTK